MEGVNVEQKCHHSDNPKAVPRGFLGNPQTGSATDLIYPCSLTQIKFLKRKNKNLPFSRDYIHLCRAASQKLHNVVHICLGDLSFSFWLPRKHDSQMKGHFTSLTAHRGGNSKSLCLTVVPKRKLPKSKFYILKIIEKATFCHILPS